jgi:hypothetical protein
VAPQLELLKQASVCITHAGLNTVLESLAQGVPQVAIPVAYDQPGVAARIVDKQTGVATSLDKLTADHLSALLNEVLRNSTYRDNARPLQKAIAEANGLSVTADLVEQSLGIRTSSKRSTAMAGGSVTDAKRGATPWLMTIDVSKHGLSKAKLSKRAKLPMNRLHSLEKRKSNPSVRLPIRQSVKSTV